MKPNGIAIVAVLSLLAAVSLLMLSYSALATVNWLSARNLRQGLHAWSRAEAAVSVVTAELEESFRRDSGLPDSYALDGAQDLDATIAYVRTAPDRGEVEIVARFGKAAVRRVLTLDMSTL